MELAPPVYAGLAADEWGVDEARPTLVLLHGLTFDRAMWRPLRAELERAGDGRRVVALDLPGHGASAERESYRLEDVVGDVHDAVEAAGLEAPVLVGHSIASGIATLYATRYPVAGIVNVDGSLRAEVYAEQIQALAPRLGPDGFDDVWRTVFWPSMRTELLPIGAQELLRETTRPRRELVLGYWADLLDTDPHDLAELVGAALAELAGRGVPYHVVAGDELDAAYRRWLAERLPQATVTVVPGSGHFPHLARPDVFADCLEAFTRWTRGWSYVGV